MDRTTEAGEVLMNSLSLLGVSLTHASREYGCEIRQNMFAQANQKGLNTMLHMLLERIKGKETLRKELKGIWPVKDTMHQKEFNKAVHKVVTGLSQQGFMPKHLASYLLQGFRQLSGSRIVTMLCYLAAYALTKNGASTAAQTSFTFKEPPSNPAALEALYRSLRSQTALERASFATSLTKMSSAQAEWMAAVEKLVQTYQDHWTVCGQIHQGKASSKEGVETQNLERECAEAEASAEAAAEEIEATERRKSLQEAAAKASELWESLAAGAARQKELKMALKAIVTASKHPYEINGAKLQRASMESAEFSAKITHVDIRHLLQDWQKLIENYDEVIPAKGYIEGMERLSREIAPLLAPAQQKQICTLQMQHHSRLQTQRQLHESLQQALASAVERREALQAQASAGTLGAEPSSPCRDLIRASYPDSLPSPQHSASGLGTNTSMLRLTGASSKLPAGGKGSAVVTRADLSTAAARCAFHDGRQLLRPYKVTTEVAALQPTGSTASFDAAFLPPSNAFQAEGGAEQLKKACMAYIEEPNPAEPSSAQQPTSQMKLKPGEFAPAPAQAAPRRLSFSGVSPSVAAGVALDSVVRQGTEKAAPLQQSLSTHTGQARDPVADIMARMHRLHA